MTDIKVFIGSANESKKYAQMIADLLRTLAADERIPVTPIGWWEPDVFPPSSTAVESLERILKRTSAALVILGAEDRTVSRGTITPSPRDNALFELAYWMGTHGRRNVAFATIGETRLPSDLWGVFSIALKLDNFRESNREKLREWILSLQDDADSTFERIVDRLQSLRPDDPRISELKSGATIDFDEKATMDVFNDVLLKKVTSCKSIMALDVVGPRGWSRSSAYRYLAPQLKHYLRANIKQDRWELYVGPELQKAILTSIGNAKQRRPESLTFFDNPTDFQWNNLSAAVPNLEYSRVLLWSPEELIHPVAQTVIAIHEEFHVPLFYCPTPPDDPLRDDDFILLADDSGRIITGLTAQRRTGYQQAGVLPDVVAKRLHRNYLTTIERSTLEFAVDARDRLSAANGRRLRTR